MTTTLTIDLDAIAANWRLLVARHSAPVAAVIKADGYGLGAIPVARKLQQAGCKHFFTAHLSEALAVRDTIPDEFLAVLNGLQASDVEIFAAHNIRPVLGSLAEIELWCAHAKTLDRPLSCLIHIDTGMNRLGLPPSELAILANDPSLLSGLSVDYMMTHLVAADEPASNINARQAASFYTACTHFPGIKTSFANSSGLFLGSAFTSDLARPGAALYGVNPTPGLPNPLRQTVHLSAKILQIRDIQSGESVGYSAAWTANRPSRIATIAVGYADGYLRHLSNNGAARFDGAPIPLVGRVSMDLTTFDVTGTKAMPGDALVLLDAHYGVDDLAQAAGTNGYEILTSFRNRCTRVYLGA